MVHINYLDIALSMCLGVIVYVCSFLHMYMTWYLHINVNQKTASNRPWLNYRHALLNAQMSVQFPCTKTPRNDTHICMCESS